MSEQNKIVIVGGHGKIALLAAPKLVDSGFRVESLIRNPDHAEEVAATGAAPVVLDIEVADTSALAEAFAGAWAVVFSAGAGGGNPARTKAVDHQAAVRTMDAAAQAGVRRYVMVSYSRSEVDIHTLDPQSSFYPYAEAKHHADNYLRGTELDYTILGPGKLTAEPASGKILVTDAAGAAASSQDGPAATETSRENVAEVIRHVLAQGAAVRQTVNFFDGESPIAEAIS
ncbi:SDR family oxidoreductase [Nesterenkonia alkaliphila]|uniref:NAD(P)H-binding protein n=1 Tax=Nesterenkonia alkaliphila TaxID=1463631 RepID=A0A7K1UGQ8_9MICC|nr:SDR family oxidoreductase [Nesterenkonia alkaliphila]MVT25566.1 NAD(P)H-binding protein [Nesterenkonia alkaliphila]